MTSLLFGVVIVPMHAHGSNGGAGSSPNNFSRKYFQSIWTAREFRGNPVLVAK